MVEPKARAERIETLYPWLLHWSIRDERIGGFRSDAYAVETPDGWMLIDAVPVEESLLSKLRDVGGLFLTHGNHQRSAWRLRRATGARVYAPATATGLEEEPDVRVDARTALPGGLEALEAEGFDDAFYLTFQHADGQHAGGTEESADTGVAFCGDLVCQDPEGPYRFPVQPGYFDLAGGREDARRLLERTWTVLCAAHAAPLCDGGRAALQRALDRGSGEAPDEATG